ANANIGTLQYYPTRRSSDLGRDDGQGLLTRLQRLVELAARQVIVAEGCLPNPLDRLRELGEDRGRELLWRGARRAFYFDLVTARSEEHTSELQSREKLVCHR